MPVDRRHRWHGQMDILIGIILHLHLLSEESKVDETLVGSTSLANKHYHPSLMLEIVLS